MRPVLPLGIVLFVLSGVGVADIPSIIVLSASDVDSGQEVTQPWTGDRTFYLWFVNYPTSELQFGFGGSLEVVSFTPAAGAQNVGTLSSPQIIFDAGCAGMIGGEILLGTVVVRDPDGSGGSVCFIQSQSSGRRCFFECDLGYWFELTPYDLHTAPGSCPVPAGSPDCLPVSVDDTTWGSVKSRYQ